MRYLYVTLFLVLFTAGSASGQLKEPDKLTSGSIYSALGLGQPVDYRASYADGMGLIGLAVYDAYAPSLANPAFWGRNVLAQATGGVKLFRYNARDRTGNSQTARFSVNMFQAVFPLVRNKLSTSVSLHPLTRTSFTAFEQVTLPPSKNNSRDSLTYGIENHGSGGLNRLELGLGWKINPHLSVGYAASYIFGPKENRLSVLFGSTDYRQIQLTKITKHQGFGNRFGVLITPTNIFKPNDQLNVGLTANLPVKLQASRFIESDKQIGNEIRTIQVTTEEDYGGERTITYPMKLGAGINYKPNALWSVSGELQFSRWSEYEGFAPRQTHDMVDRYRAGLGARFRPYQGEYDSFYSRFKYNAGISYDTGYLKLQGHRIQTLKFSAGLGILSPDNRASVDLTLHYGVRGTLKDGLVRENIWGLRMSLNLAELMFYRPKLR